MRNILRPFGTLALISALIWSCSEDDTVVTHQTTPDDNIPATIAPVSGFTVAKTSTERELAVTWTNPEDEFLHKVEISYEPEGVNSRNYTPEVVFVDAESAESGSIKLQMPEHGTYTIRAVAINTGGIRSSPVSAVGTPAKRDDEEYTPPAEEAENKFFVYADAMMVAVMDKLLGKSPKAGQNVWTNNYPRNTSEPYWDDAAMIWAHGSGYSAFVALREATVGHPTLETKYKNLEDRMWKGTQQFFYSYSNNAYRAYACWPGSGNDRYYDDNAWVGLDMIDMYNLTGDQKYLTQAKYVWDYLMMGTDSYAGGGINWKQQPASTGKNTCSTAPGAVLGAKLYIATHEQGYLDKTIELYDWLVNIMQDPGDKLFYDNVKENGSGGLTINKGKLPYNAGQPMQAAVLLYNITGDQKYLDNAKAIAASSHRTWSTPFTSYAMDETFNIFKVEQSNVWFTSIMFRGFFELYKVTGDRTYLDDMEKSLQHAWLKNRDAGSGLMNNDPRGGGSQTSWNILNQGAYVEMYARMAALKRDEAAQAAQ